MSEQYRAATRTLMVGPPFLGVIAHVVGDLVPAKNVALHGWEDGTARMGTKAAKDAGQAAEDPDPSAA